MLYATKIREDIMQMLDSRSLNEQIIIGSTTTDREQRRLAEKGDPKYIFTIPRAILPKPSLCDEITATKSSLRGQFVRGQFVTVSFWLVIISSPNCIQN